MTVVKPSTPKGTAHGDLRILVTGFPPFPGRPVNPSQDLVQAVQSGALLLPGLTFHGALLPVEYARVEREIEELLDTVRPDIWLAYGVGGQAVPFRLESRGVNRDDSTTPDNSGEVRRGVAIESSGPGELRTQTDLECLRKLLSASGCPTEISLDAGTYVCNHVLYFAMSLLGRRAPPVEFMFTHLAPAEQGMNLEMSLLGLQITALWFQNQRLERTPGPNSQRA